MFKRVAGIRISALAASLIGIMAGTSVVQAEPKLAVAVCDELRTQAAALEAAGIKIDLARGPDWAKQNLTEDRIKLVLSYIDLAERVMFRCAPPVPPEPVPPVPERVVRPDGATGGVAQIGPTKEKVRRIPPLPQRKPKIG